MNLLGVTGSQPTGDCDPAFLAVEPVVWQEHVLQCSKPRAFVASDEISFDLPATDLVNGSVANNLNGLGSPALKIHRTVAEREFTFKFEKTLENPSEINGFLYTRIVQSDGQVGWTSPIWYE